MRSKCSVISDTKSEIDDNYIFTSRATDTNQNINEFSVSILLIFFIFFPLKFMLDSSSDSVDDKYLFLILNHLKLRRIKHK